jgi:transposase-like protein
MWYFVKIMENLSQNKSVGKPVCKKCGSTHSQKNGFKNNVQRYKCKDCGCVFIRGDRRVKLTPEKIALCVLFYAAGRASFRFLAKIFDVSDVGIMKALKKDALMSPVPEILEDIEEIECDEMWHFLVKKKQKFGFGKRLIVRQIELSPGKSALAMLLPLENSTKKSSTPARHFTPTTG